MVTLFPIAGSGIQLQQQRICKVQKRKQSVHSQDHQTALDNKSGEFSKNHIVMATLVRTGFFELDGAVQHSIVPTSATREVPSREETNIQNCTPTFQKEPLFSAA